MANWLSTETFVRLTDYAQESPNPGWKVIGLNEIYSLTIITELRAKLDEKYKNKCLGSSILIGGSGSHKTQNCIFPTVDFNDNAIQVITDPKWELYDHYEGKLRKIAFNGSRTDISAKWNPMVEITSLWEENKKQECDDSITSICDVLIPQADDVNAYFTNTSNKWLKGFIYYWLETKMYKTKPFNLYNLIAHSISVDAKKFVPILHMCPTALLYLSDFDDSQQSKNVQSVFISKLSPFLNENIKSITTESNFNINEVFLNPCKVFIKIDTSNKNSAINTLSTLLMKTIYNKARDYLSEKHLSALPIPLQYVMEEFGNLPKIDFVPKIFSLNRGENIFALLVLQSKSQVISTYGEHIYQEIFDSCQCLFVFALTNVEFARELEAMSGTSEVERKTVTKEKKENDEKSESISKDKEAKVAAEDFLRKNSNEFIFIVKNETPFKCRFIPGWMIKEKKETKNEDGSKQEDQNVQIIGTLWVRLKPKWKPNLPNELKSFKTQKEFDDWYKDNNERFEIVSKFSL